MMSYTSDSGLSLLFEYDFDEASAFDAKCRGYLSHVSIKLLDGAVYPVTFYDPIRLQQDLEEENGRGHSVIAIPGLMIVPEVNLQYMVIAADIAASEGFFSHICRRTITEGDSRSPSSEWPPKR